MLRIYGAGMAGLLASNMLRKLEHGVFEIQPSLPHNHSALLRFRSDVVAEATGIPFRKVRVRKGIMGLDGALHNESNIALDNLYSYKVTGQYLDRSSANLTSSDRYIAPSDFIQQCSKNISIDYRSPLTLGELECNGPIISTIPMPTLMDIVGWPKEERPEFSSIPIWTIEVYVAGADIYQTVYFPGLDNPCYRISITGDKLIAEFVSDPDIGGYALLRDNIEKAFGIFGVWRVIKKSCQQYGKLRPTDNAKRQAFIIHMTNEYECYSLGRFATWRQILLDDVVQDVRRIDTWMTSKSEYQRIMAQSNKGV